MQRALDSAMGLAQQVDERVLDAGVLDASGREQELHAASGNRFLPVREVLRAYGPVRGSCVYEPFPAERASRTGEIV
jgi:hypothetical protein